MADVQSLNDEELSQVSGGSGNINSLSKGDVFIWNLLSTKVIVIAQNYTSQQLSGNAALPISYRILQMSESGEVAGVQTTPCTVPFSLLKSQYTYSSALSGTVNF